MAGRNRPYAQRDENDFRDFQPDRRRALAESVTQPAGPGRENHKWQDQTAKPKGQNHGFVRLYLRRRKIGRLQLRLGDRDDQPAVHVVRNCGEKAHQQEPMNEDDLRLERGSLPGNICEDTGDISGDFQGFVDGSLSSDNSGPCRFLIFPEAYPIALKALIRANFFCLLVEN